MSPAPHLVAKSVVDVNGRATTVYVNPARSGSAGRSRSVPPPTANALGKNSRINDVIRERARVHAVITSSHADGASYDELRPLIDERERLAKIISADVFRSRDDGDDIAVSDAVIDSAFVDGDTRIGYSNNLLEHDIPRDAVRDSTVDISALWLDSLSSAEAVAVVRYTGYSREYAVEHAEGKFSPVWEDFESAVARAPKVEPFVAYTGVNDRYVKDLITQADSGEVVLDRVFSSSMNPAQVNGFATSVRTENGEIIEIGTLVLEVETTVGAFMDTISNVPHEMEVMLPKGRYEVIDSLEGVTYLWRDGGVGRTMDRTLRLCYLGE